MIYKSKRCVRLQLQKKKTINLESELSVTTIMPITIVFISLEKKKTCIRVVTLSINEKKVYLSASKKIMNSISKLVLKNRSLTAIDSIYIDE